MDDFRRSEKNAAELDSLGLLDGTAGSEQVTGISTNAKRAQAAARIIRHDEDGLIDCLLLGRPAAVDEDVGSRDEPRRFRTEVAGQRANLLDFAPAANRQVREEQLIGFGIAHNRCIHVGSERPWADAVDGNSFSGKLQCQRARQAKKGGLRRGVRGASWE